MSDLQPADFDKYSTDYSSHVDKSVRFSGQSADFFHRIKVDTLLELLARFIAPERAVVLDVGCGTGSLSRLMAPRVNRLLGVDISRASVERAQEAVPNGKFEEYDGITLPFADNSVDLVFTSCVMHHVPPEQWPRFANEMTRVAGRNGLVAVLEHNPWNPLTRYAVSNCEFDKDAVLLSRRKTMEILTASGLKIVAKPYILFFPWKWDVLRTIESKLARLPLGGQYIVLGRKTDNSILLKHVR